MKEPIQTDIFGKIPKVETYKEDKDIINKYGNYILANKKWYPKGIKSYLLLMSPQGIAAAAGVSSTNKIGFRIGFTTYENQYMRWAYDPRDFKKISEVLINQNKNSPEAIKNYEKNFWKETDAFKRKADETYWNFNSENLKEIKKQLIEVIDSGLRAQSYGYVTEVFTITSDEYWVTKYIKELAPNLTGDEISKLLQSGKHSFIKLFHDQLRTYNSEKDFKKIIEKFYWVKGSYFTLPKLTIELLGKEKNELKNEEDPFSKLKKDKENIINKTLKSKELRNFIDMLEIFISIQDERKANVLRLNYSLLKLVELVNKKFLNWTIEDLLCFTPLELIDLLENKINKNQKEVLRNRNNKSVWIFSNEGYYITSDSKIINIYFPLFEDKSESLKGVVACKGNVTGTARIVFSEEDFSKLKDGEILVTSMTRPEFLPVMKKASAFVTDEGGITCHAAIVSREMNKPCIIGTKNATKILKDGDLIEVNAIEGLIKIIKKK